MIFLPCSHPSVVHLGGLRAEKYHLRQFYFYESEDNSLPIVGGIGGGVLDNTAAKRGEGGVLRCGSGRCNFGQF